MEQQTGDINFNAQGDITIGGHVVGRDLTITYEAPAPLALSLHQLPPPPRDFTGRTAELAELMAAVEKGGVTISGVHGLGGIGKTALALKLAEQLADRYPDAQFYLDLKGVSDKPLTPSEALAHVVRAYYPTSKLPDGEAELRALYHSVLQGKRALLMMDNAKDASQVEPLMPPATCYLLITSRRHFTLPGLFAKNLEQMPPREARDLLLKIAQRIGEHADEIARLCGHLPLALRLTASALAERVDLTPADLIRRLNDAQKRLKLTGVDVPLRLSYDLLTPEPQKLWRALAVFPDSFDRAAAMAVWKLADEDQAQDALGELVRYSLLDFSPHPSPLPSREREPTPLSLLGRGAGGEGRYRLHDLARLFADSHLTKTERHEAQQRQAAHYESVLRTANELYEKGGDSIKRGLTLFDLEWANIQAGQAWATANAKEDEVAAQLCSNYSGIGVYVLDLRQHPRDKIRWLEAALAAAGHLKNRKAEGVHLGNLGIAYRELGDARRAIEFYEQALALGREIGDRRGEGVNLGNLGNAYAVLGDTRRAIDFYEQQLIIVHEIRDRRGEGNALSDLGLVYADLGDAHRAIEFYEQALTLDRELGDRRGDGADLGNLGNAYVVLGDIRRAIELHEQALALHRELGDRRGEGDDLGNLGNAHAALGNMHNANEFYKQQLSIVCEIGDRRGEGNALFNMSLSLSSLGNYAQAIAHAEAALKIFEQIESPHTEMVRKQLAEWGLNH